MNVHYYKNRKEYWCARVDGLNKRFYVTSCTPTLADAVLDISRKISVKLGEEEPFICNHCKRERCRCVKW